MIAPILQIMDTVVPAAAPAAGGAPSGPIFEAELTTAPVPPVILAVEVAVRPVEGLARDQALSSGPGFLPELAPMLAEPTGLLLPETDETAMPETTEVDPGMPFVAPDPSVVPGPPPDPQTGETTSAVVQVSEPEKEQDVRAEPDAPAGHTLEKDVSSQKVVSSDVAQVLRSAIAPASDDHGNAAPAPAPLTTRDEPPTAATELAHGDSSASPPGMRGPTGAMTGPVQPEGVPAHEVTIEIHPLRAQVGSVAFDRDEVDGPSWPAPLAPVGGQPLIQARDPAVQGGISDQAEASGRQVASTPQIVAEPWTGPESAVAQVANPPLDLGVVPPRDPAAARLLAAAAPDRILSGASVSTTLPLSHGGARDVEPRALTRPEVDLPTSAEIRIRAGGLVAEAPAEGPVAPISEVRPKAGQGDPPQSDRLTEPTGQGMESPRPDRAERSLPDTRGADHPTFETAAEPEPSFDGAEPSGGFGAMDRPSASVDQPRRLVLAAAPAPAADPALREGVEVAQQENAALEVTLRPEELGRVTMTMAQEGDSLRVLVQAERADTLDLLRRNSDQLGAELRQAGFSGASFSFGGRDGEPPPRPRPAMENRLQPSPVSAAPSGVPQTGLDLRI